MKNVGMRDSREKGAGMRDQDPAFQTLGEQPPLLSSTCADCARTSSLSLIWELTQRER